MVAPPGAGAVSGTPGLAFGIAGKSWLVAGAGLAGLTLMVSLIGGFGGGGEAGYPQGSGVPKVYWPMYQAAADHYGVNTYLVASIHKQESHFSGTESNPPDPATGVASGVNSYGCCAGPMQFNLKSGTWNGHKLAFREIEDARPATYPQNRFNAGACGAGGGGGGDSRNVNLKRSPTAAYRPATGPASGACEAYRSCRGVADNEGCVYDDFDAIAAAAHKLKADGADKSLTSAGTHDAVCAYIGDCSEVDQCVAGSPNQYCQVLPRAIEWEQMALVASAGSAILSVSVRLTEPAQDFRIPAKYMAAGHGSGLIDARLWPSLRYLLETYDAAVTAGKETGHLSHGDGTAVDLIPASGNLGSQGVWDRTIGRMAADLGWTRACGSSGSRPACTLVPAVEWVGYDGYQNHGSPASCGGGCPMHIHISWASETHGTPYLTTPEWVLAFPISGGLQ